MGQKQILESYGVTEEFCGCPIRSSMDSRIVCHAAEGFPVYFDATAFAADHVIVCNRVKPHTSLVLAGDIKSGLMKMMLIGLGKHAGAKVLPSSHLRFFIRTDCTQCCQGSGRPLFDRGRPGNRREQLR